MKAFVKRFLGNNFKVEELKNRKIIVDTFDPSLYKIWNYADEFKDDDVFKRLYHEGSLVSLDLYVKKPAYLSIGHNHADIFSFDDSSFLGVTETVKDIFNFNESPLPRLNSFSDNTKVESIHFFNRSSSMEISIVLDRQRTKKDLSLKLKPEFKGDDLISFLIELNYNKGGLYTTGAKLFKDQLELYFSPESYTNVNKINEYSIIKNLSGIIDSIYQEFNKL